MKKDIKDYLHLYLGCECMIGDLSWKPETNLYGLAPGVDVNYGKPIKTRIDAHVLNVFSFKTTLILRPLSDMTEEECQYLAWFHMDSDKHLDAEARISSEEVDINVVYGDGGLMVDSDAAVVIEISCRCFIGQLCVRTNGDLEMWDEDKDERLPIERQCENFRYLLSKGFDLFGLIEAGLAIDKTTLNVKAL